jgi:hypothetical protein
MKVPLEMGNRNGLMVPKEYAGPKKLVIAWVHGGQCEPDFYESLLEFLLHDGSQHGRHIFAGVASRRSIYVTDNRNECVRDFLATPADAMLWIDPDHRFSHEQVYRLVDSLDADHPIVGGLYFNYMKNGHLYPIWHEESGNPAAPLQLCSKTNLNEIREVAAVGTGFMAVQRRVFEAMREADDGSNGDHVWFRREMLVDTRLSEDVSFCLRARKLGFKVWGNSYVVVDHRKGVWLNWDHFVKHWQADEG